MRTSRRWRTNPKCLCNETILRESVGELWPGYRRTHTAYTIIEDGQVHVRLTDRDVYRVWIISCGLSMSTCLSLHSGSLRLTFDGSERDKIVSKLGEQLQLLARVLLQDI